MVGRTLIKQNLISLVLFLFYSTTAYAGEIRVIDGDTFILDDKRIRLWGIDAPELRQKYEEFACGEAAKKYLQSIITDTITCEIQDTDRYSRSVARCFIGITDIGGLLVENGWA